MTRDQQLEAIRAACIKANPNRHRENARWWHRYEPEPVRLADVLLAVTELGRPMATRSRSLIMDALVQWDLMRDDLAQQSDECVAFPYDLLK